MADMPIDGAGTSHMGNADDVNTDNVYLTGGVELSHGGTWISGAYSSNVVLEYNTATNTFTKLDPLPNTMGGCVAVVRQGFLHVMGGANVNGGFKKDLNDHYMLDLYTSGATWVTLAPMSQVRNHLGAAIGPDGAVYAIGGQLNEWEGCSNKVLVEAYNPVTNTWIKKKDLPLPLGHIAPATIGTPHGIVIVGGTTNKANGCNPPGSHPSKIYHYDPKTDSWKTISTNNAGASMVCGIIGNFLYAQHEKSLDKHPISWTNQNTVSL